MHCRTHLPSAMHASPLRLPELRVSGARLLYIARAIVIAQTDFAPLSRSWPATSVSVVPVVKMSSTRTIDLPRTNGSLASKAPDKLALRSFRLNPYCGAVFRLRANSCVESGRSTNLLSLFAINSAWLYPRVLCRSLCMGTGTISAFAPTSLAPAFAKQFSTTATNHP
jgi:hypothetical protein